VEIWSEKTGSFKVNGQRLKHYLAGEPKAQGRDLNKQDSIHLILGGATQQRKEKETMFEWRLQVKQN
jgi:hypothetical protein